jgi:hypothetical protein
MRPCPGVALLATLACLTGAAVARADGGSRVVIVRDRSADPVVDRAEVRLAAELRAAGFTVEERVVDGDDDARRVVEETREEALPRGAGSTTPLEKPAEGGPFATVLLRRAGARAATDVWVADHVTHKTVVRRMGSRGGSDAAARALALRVVELMRASLVEGLVLPPSDDDLPPPTPPPSSPAPPPPTPPVLPADVGAWTRDALHTPLADRPSHVRLSLGVAGAFAGPDLGVAVAPVLRVGWLPARAWTVALVAVGPGFGAHVTAPEGTASVRQELALAEVAFEPPTEGAVSGFLALGAGAYHLYASGDATPPYTSSHDDAWAALFAAGAGVRVHLSGAASLVVDAREGITLPRPVVLFASQRVAEAMHPGTLGGVSLAVDL